MNGSSHSLGEGQNQNDLQLFSFEVHEFHGMQTGINSEDQWAYGASPRTFSEDSLEPCCRTEYVVAALKSEWPQTYFGSFID
jgi:hypothetical protein